ncbi:hypothetical protein Chor_013762 [Crotalus horridus]
MGPAQDSKGVLISPPGSEFHGYWRSRAKNRHDEVIAASEKVTVKLEDLAQWARTDISKWKRGVRDEAFTPPELSKDGQREALSRFRQSTHNSGLNFKDILKEKADLGCWDQGIGLALERERNWMGQLLVGFQGSGPRSGSTRFSSAEKESNITEVNPNAPKAAEDVQPYPLGLITDYFTSTLSHSFVSLNVVV